MTRRAVQYNGQDIGDAGSWGEAYRVALAHEAGRPRRLAGVAMTMAAFMFETKEDAR